MNATSMVPVSLSKEDFEDLYDMAGYVIGYWASSSVWENDRFFVTDSHEKDVHVVTRSGMIHLIAEIISGKYDLCDRIRHNITHAITQSDLGDLDGYDVDALVQLACFKELVYG